MMNLFAQPCFSFRIGDEVAGFRILGLAGCGASGEVYLVEDLSGERLALKITAERQEIAGMTAYRTLPVNDFFIAIHAVGKLPDGRAYLLMEAADGLNGSGPYSPDTLAARLRRGPLAAKETLRILIRLLSGVQLLHERGLIHGDVKPENVLFCSGKAKLSDFGTLGSGERFTGGTPDFFPPEAYDGAGQPISSPQNDLYALGKLLYCLWTGRAPAEFPTPPESADGAAFRLIRPLYAKACDRNPAYRFRSAAEMRDAAERALKKLRRLSQRRILPVIGKWCLRLAAAGMVGFAIVGTLVVLYPDPAKKAAAAAREAARLDRYAKECADLDAMLAFCSPEKELYQLLLQRKTEVREFAAAGKSFSKLPEEPPEVRNFRDGLLRSPELYLSAEFIARVRSTLIASRRNPPLQQYSELFFRWAQIQSECRRPKMNFAERKQLAEDFQKALDRLESSRRTDQAR